MINLKRFIIGLSLLIFIISLTQKCYCIASDCTEAFNALIFGFITLGTEAVNYSWLANPLLFAAWFTLFKKEKLSFVLSLCALSLALFFLFFGKGVVYVRGNLIYEDITAIKSGYWIWVLSISIMAISTATILMNKKQAS